MLSRTLFFLFVLIVPATVLSSDILDYKKVGPAQQVERIAHTLVEGSGSERRAATEEAHELGEKYLSAEDGDERIAQYFSVAGEAIIPLMWSATSTTRVRCERIISEFIDDLGKLLPKGKEGFGAEAAKLLDRYGALLAAGKGNSSADKLLDQLERVYKGAGLEANFEPATEFDSFAGLPDPMPHSSKKEESAEEVKAPVAPEPQQPEAVKKAPVAKVEEKKPASPPEPAKKPMVVSMKGKGGGVAAPPPTKVISAAKPVNRVSARKVSARRFSAAGTAAGAVAGSGGVVSVSAKKLSGVTGAIGASPSSSGARSRPRTEAQKRGSSAALRILGEELQSDSVSSQLSAFRLASTLYDDIRGAAIVGIGDERKIAQTIIVRCRLLVGSSDRSVKKAAITAVGELGDDKSVGQLIRLLPEGGGMGELALEALRKITGEDFGTSVEKWIAWEEGGS